MRKIVFFVALCSLLSLMLDGSAFAAKASQKAAAIGKAHRNTGCGLGTMLLKSSADESTILQTIQQTLNGTGMQSFGITSGTSECDQPSKFVSNERANEFVLANMDNLAKDIAKGQGETLDAFAELLQVPADKRAEFYQKLQASFTKIFTSEDVVLANVMDNIATVSSN